MKQVKSISVKELEQMAEQMFGGIVKADVDIAKKLVVLDMPMHFEGEAYFLENGSKQRDLWGINLHPSDYGTDDFIEFDSMINIRPSQGNPSKDVIDPNVRQSVRDIISEVVHE
jgi:hypothetical protein